MLGRAEGWFTISCDLSNPRIELVCTPYIFTYPGCIILFSGVGGASSTIRAISISPSLSSFFF